MKAEHIFYLLETTLYLLFVVTCICSHLELHTGSLLMLMKIAIGNISFVIANFEEHDKQDTQL